VERDEHSYEEDRDYDQFCNLQRKEDRKIYTIVVALAITAALVFAAYGNIKAAKTVLISSGGIVTWLILITEFAWRL